MAKSYVGTGTASKDGVIRLDDGAGLPKGRVRVIVEPERPEKRGSLFDIPPARDGRRAEEILQELRSFRDEWDGQG